MEQPFVPYQRNVLGMVEETFPRKEDILFTERIMAGPPDDDVKELVSEKNVSEKGVETKLEDIEEEMSEIKEKIEEEGLEEEEKEVEEDESEEEEEEKDDEMIPSKTSDDWAQRISNEQETKGKNSPTV